MGRREVKPAQMPEKLRHAVLHVLPMLVTAIAQGVNDNE
jgi:hypothetical protein